MYIKIIRIIYQHKYFPILLLATINLLVAYFFIKKPFWASSDYFTYESAVDYIRGVGGEAVYLNRILTMPLTIGLASFLGVFVGNMGNGFVLLNVFFYFAIAIVFYELARLVFKNSQIAQVATVFLLGNYWLFSYGAAYSGDKGGIFFFLLANFFALKYYFSRQKKYFFITIIIASVGVLFKEFGALGMIALGMAILLSNYTWKEKFKQILEAAILFLILPALFHVGFYLYYHYSYFDWYDVALTVTNTLYTIPMFIKVLGWLFIAGWPIFLYSLPKIKKHFKVEDYKIAIMLLPASLSFFIWPLFTQRTAFVLVPWLALYTGFGLAQIKNKYIIYFVLAFYVIIGYLTETLLPLINVPFL
jgi:hypothetical protein